VQIGAKEQGVKTVASMLNITRLYNAICSIGQMERGLDLLRDYSGRREVFGQKLNDQVLHYSTFALDELKGLAGFVLGFELVHMLGREESGAVTGGESEILRLMTPICKLMTARTAIRSASEVIEGFGGAGYIEDVGLAVNLRDAQVFPIWEGATNVLSLDMIRVMQKSNALQALKEDIACRLRRVKGFEAQVKTITGVLGELEKNLQAWSQSPARSQMASARGLAFYLGKLYAYVLLLDWSAQESDANRRVLGPWLSQYTETYLRHWRPLSEDECERRQKMWMQRLEN
jgi:hypothetical protein